MHKRRQLSLLFCPDGALGYPWLPQMGEKYDDAVKRGKEILNYVE